MSRYFLLISYKYLKNIVKNLNFKKYVKNMWADDNLLKKMFGSYSKLYLHLKFFKPVI